MQERSTCSRWQIDFAREVANRLLSIVFGQVEVLFVEVRNDPPLLVPNGSEDVHHLDVGRKRGLFLLCEQRQASQTKTNRMNAHQGIEWQLIETMDARLANSVTLLSFCAGGAPNRRREFGGFFGV